VRELRVHAVRAVDLPDGVRGFVRADAVRELRDLRPDMRSDVRHLPLLSEPDLLHRPHRLPSLRGRLGCVSRTDCRLSCWRRCDTNRDVFHLYPHGRVLPKRIAHHLPANLLSHTLRYMPLHMRHMPAEPMHVRPYMPHGMHVSHAVPHIV
jgi:hypothetical protein